MNLWNKRNNADIPVPLRQLVNHMPFRQAAERYANGLAIRFNKIDGGAHKCSYTASSGDNKVFVVKWIGDHCRISAPLFLALLEFKVIGEIARQPEKTRKHFPKNIGLFALERNTGESRDIESLHNNGSKSLFNGNACNFFIVEEYIEGEKPMAKHLKAAQKMRLEGMKQNPGIWLTIETDRDDIKVRGKNDIVFLDAGRRIYSPINIVDHLMPLLSRFNIMTEDDMREYLELYARTDFSIKASNSLEGGSDEFAPIR